MSRLSLASRQVQRLHLRAPDETFAGRGVRLLEDALRTASLPDAGARILLFRRLTMGRFGSGTSSRTLSLRLEQRVAALRSLAVHALAPGAAGSAAVWFRDAIEAHTLLAQRIADGTPTHEWFWALVVPGIEAAAAAPDRVRLVIRSLGRYPEAPTALPLLAGALAQRGYAHLLREAVGATETAALLAASATLARPASSAVAPLRGRIPAARDVRNLERPSATTMARPLIDNRPAAAAETAAADGAESSQHPVPVGPAVLRVAADPRATTETRRGQHGEAASIATRQQRGVTDAAYAETAPGRRNDDGASATAGVLADPAAEAVESRAGFQRPQSAAPAPHRHDEAGGEPLAQAQSDEVPTRVGGLIFLLPVLTRLGYAQWLDAAPEWAPARIDTRVLALVCQHLDLPADDPAWRLCNAPALATPTLYRAPEIWTQGIADCSRAWRRHAGGGGVRVCDASGRLLLAAWPGGRPPAAFDPLLRGRRITRWRKSPRPTEDLAAAVAGAWLIACRRWLRRFAGLGVATLVARPARFSLTSTHADMFFDLSGVSLAVRRAGLDLDPGWVPWFGRVVGFHYGRMP